MNFFFSPTIISILLSTSMVGQEIETPLPCNKQLVSQNKSLKSSKNRENQRGLKSLELPFVEDFSIDHFIGNQDGNDVLWLDRKVFRNTTFAINPPTVGVATFDGLNELGLPYNANDPTAAQNADTLTSDYINLFGATEVGLSFFFQREGYGNFPDPNENLILEFFSPADSNWQNVWEGAGGTGVDAFEFVYIPVDNVLNLVDSFQFRFRNLGNITGSLDHWHIDYVQIAENSTNATSVISDVAFVDVPYTLLQQYSAVPWKHFKADASTYMNQSVNLNLFNLSNVQRTMVDNKFTIKYNSMQLSEFINTSNPPILVQSGLVYNHSVNQTPNNFIFDTSVNDTSAVFEVGFSHGVSDDNASNNSINFKQNFSDYYAYDDGTAERGIGFNGGPGKFAVKYNLTFSDSIYGLSIYFLPTQFNVDGDLFYLYLWDDNNSSPGNEIASSQQFLEYSPNFENEFLTYYFDAPILLPIGNYYVGVGQTTADNFSIGNDKNTNANQTKLFTDANSDDQWQNSTIPGSICIRPLFVSPLGNQVTLAENSIANLLVYPNPATDHINISSSNLFNFIIVDLAGKEIIKGGKSNIATIDVSSFSNGIYFLKISDPQSGKFSTEKIMVQNK